MTAKEQAREYLRWLYEESWGSPEFRWCDAEIERLAADITAAIDQRERELIPLFCDEYCEDGYEALRKVRDGAGWWYHVYLGRCPASPLHESIRARGLEAEALDEIRGQVDAE